MFASRMLQFRTDSAECPRRNSRRHGVCRIIPTADEYHESVPVAAQQVSAPCTAIRWVLGCLIVAAFSGCQAFSNQSDAGLFGGMLSTGNIRGPLERSLYAEDNVLDLGRKFSPEAKARVDAATAKFEQGNYRAAAKEFKSAARKYKDSSIGEEAQYRLGEAKFAMGDLPGAQDAFDQLFADYPSTRYVEPATRRLFAIAKHWLEVSDPVAKSEIRQVSGEKVMEDSAPARPPRDPTLRVRLLPNFHDGSRPVFDTQGRALEALKAIWLNDPTGPLADDALMLTATYYQRTRNYVEADRYYKILREEYSTSPHFEKAFVLGSHVKLMSYQGPHYEGSDLQVAEKLKEQSLHLFPASSSRSQTRKDLDKLYLMQAERAWANVDYWQKKGRPRAIALACINVIMNFPDTQYAVESRRILRGIDRRELQGLPEIEDLLNNLPAVDPARQTNQQPPIKSVGDSRVDPKDEGRVRL